MLSSLGGSAKAEAKGIGQRTEGKKGLIFQTLNLTSTLPPQPTLTLLLLPVLSGH